MRRLKKVAGAGDAARRRHGWLELLQTSGPFLTLPVVHRVFPDPIPAVAPARRARVRAAVERMMAGHGADRQEVVDALLDDVFEWGDHRLDEVPDAVAEPVVEHRQVVRPGLAFVATEQSGQDELDEDDADDGSADDEDDEEGEALDAPAVDDSTSTGGPWRLFGTVEPWGTHPLTRTTRDGWTANAAERLGVLLRARDVPIGLVTDGRWWAIVWAPRGGALGVAVWDAWLFGEEPDSLAALAALLDRRRFLGVAAENTLPRMLAESLERGEQLTDALGRQVRDAVELLLARFDRLDADSGGLLLRGVDDDDVYAGIVTTMMRIVFLLFAEERRLLPSDHEIYSSAYSVGTLVEGLRSYAALHGEQPLEHRTGAWHRLLATSRAVHRGVHHEDLRLPAYGGDLFDVDRFPWLEGRGVDALGVPPIDDRTVLRMLSAVQYVTVDDELRRLSFRALGVEQIGYVYEGLLELEVRTACELTLLLARHKTWPQQKLECEVTLSTAREWVDGLPDALATQVAKRTGWTSSKVEKAFREVLDEHVLADEIGAADPEAYKVALALAPALRRDERLRPMVVRPGRRFLAPSLRRASTGAHYTPPQLAHDIVTGALEPLVYRPGPLETADRSTWRTRPASELLDLRIADIAMGSGAFLVSACRYLADRVVESRAAAGDQVAERHLLSVATTDAEVPPILLAARREVVERCLYGVDVNPLAVDMAKLSLWLVTMDRERPFDFLDDRLVVGDSLLGLVELDQLTTLHIDPVAGRRVNAGGFDFADDWRKRLGEAADRRRTISEQGVQSLRDVEHKLRLLAEATAETAPLRAVADRLTGVGLRHAKTKKRSTVDNAFIATSIEVGNLHDDDPDELARLAQADLQAERPPERAPRTPFHWPVAFPEVFVDSRDPGFDAVVGNPPFLGGKKISGALGTDYLAWCQRWDGDGTKGSADLAARFVLRAQRLLSSRGQLAYIATNTLVQGDTLEVGLAQAVARGLTIRCGRSSHHWPTTSASVEIVEFWGTTTPISSSGEQVLDGEPVRAIGPDLEPVGRVNGPKYRLTENDRIVFQGSVVVGTGFTMAREEAAQLIARDHSYAEALQPYVIGKDLNQRPDYSASRWIINFRDWPLERAERYTDLIEVVRRDVKPERDKKNRVAHREAWWRYGDHRPGLYRAIAKLDRVLAISLVSNAVLPVFVSPDQVIAHKCAVFASDAAHDLAILSSTMHFVWVLRYTSTLGAGINYSPSDVFLTMPRPPSTPSLTHLGQRLDVERRELMLSRGWGLTTTYNHVHDPADHDPAVVALRDLHAEIDHAVLDAYGWSDLSPSLGIGHHRTKIGTRWTVCPEARFELLDRLLEENQRRHALETVG